MLVCYALEPRARGFVLGFAISCALASVYAFLQGAWPFGLVEAVWTVIALRRWWLRP
jgi:predicted PurR-regulated permease PerM